MAPAISRVMGLLCRKIDVLLSFKAIYPGPYFARPFSVSLQFRDLEDQETHTGQKFEKNDYRLARFVGKTKQVDPNFAINLIDEVPPAPRKERVVWCDGGGGPIGHPKIYINLDKPGNHVCGYCGLRFTKEDYH